jgi:hypothetical protein
MRRAWAAWVAVCDRRESPSRLALVRILVAVVLLVDLIVAGALGVVEAVWPGGTAWWIAAIVLAVLFGAGAATRVSGLALVVVYARLAALAPDADRGIDALFRVAIGILALSGSHACASVDAWVLRKLGRAMPAQVPSWPRHLLVLQLVWMYFSAATFKTQAPWTPFGGFSALGLILADPHFARFGPGWIGAVYPLTQAGTALTVLFEWTSPIFLYACLERPGRVGRALRFIRFRWAWLAVGAGFHVALAVTMRLGIFPYGVLALYPAFFAPRPERGILPPCESPSSGPASQG